jgi:hypothetical protein
MCGIFKKKGIFWVLWVATVNEIPTRLALGATCRTVFAVFVCYEDVRCPLLLVQLCCKYFARYVSTSWASRQMNGMLIGTRMN